MVVVKKDKKKAAIMVDPYVGNTLLIDPNLLDTGWTCLDEESLPEYGGKFYVRNGFEVFSRGLKTDLRRLGYGCLLFRWPGDTKMPNRLTFVFVPRNARVGVTQMCIIGEPKMSYLRFADRYPLAEVHQHEHGLEWRLNRGEIVDARDVTKFAKFKVKEPGYGKVSFRRNLPILQFLNPSYRRPIKRPKIIKKI